jgi:serine/threonine-protein kinase HipA
MKISMIERQYAVWLHGKRIGTLNQRGDYTWFVFLQDYLDDPERSVLGIAFEEHLGAPVTSALRLPPWFSNLLPEGRLREWIARDRGVSPDREMELLAQVGHDLSGAVQVVAEDAVPDSLTDIPLPKPTAQSSREAKEENKWRFSLAGVGLKFSMLRTGDRLTLPAYGEGGDWIVKLPDS